MSDPKNRAIWARTTFVTYKKPILFLEGFSDRSLYKRLLNDLVVLDVVTNKSCVLDVVKESQKLYTDLRGKRQFAIGIVDLDYDHIEGKIQQDSEWLLYVDSYAEAGASRDMEVMLIRSKSFSILLDKYQITTSAEITRKWLLEAGALIGAAYVLERQMHADEGREIGSYQDLDFPEFFDPLFITLDLDCFVKYKFGDRCNTSNDIRVLKEKIYRIFNRHKPSELARGHDLTEMLAMYICRVNDIDEFCYSDVERELRLNVDMTSFWSQNFGIMLRRYLDKVSGP